MTLSGEKLVHFCFHSEHFEFYHLFFLPLFVTRILNLFVVGQGWHILALKYLQSKLLLGSTHQLQY